MRLKRLAKEILMVSPPLWLEARTWWRKIANKDEAEIGMLRFLVPHDRCAIDVGANNGIYTHKLLEITAQVVAIEPNPKYVKELARIFGSRIRLIPAALSDSRRDGGIGRTNRVWWCEPGDDSKAKFAHGL